MASNVRSSQTYVSIHAFAPGLSSRSRRECRHSSRVYLTPHNMFHDVGHETLMETPQYCTGFKVFVNKIRLRKGQQRLYVHYIYAHC